MGEAAMAAGRPGGRNPNRPSAPAPPLATCATAAPPSAAAASTLASPGRAAAAGLPPAPPPAPTAAAGGRGGGAVAGRTGRDRAGGEGDAPIAPLPGARVAATGASPPRAAAAAARGTAARTVAVGANAGATAAGSAAARALRTARRGTDAVRAQTRLRGVPRARNRAVSRHCGHLAFKLLARTRVRDAKPPPRRSRALNGGSNAATIQTTNKNAAPTPRGETPARA